MDQMDKNTVEAKNQLKESDIISFENLENTGIRVLFVGNSITLHGVKENIGWMNRWGMAASARENDYVHVTMNQIQKKYPDASFGICQVADWEMNYKNGESLYLLYESARDYDANIIIMRIVENCKKNEYEKELFMEQYEKLIQFFNKSQKAIVIVTTGFWKHPADEAILECAKKNGYSVCELGDLGELDEMKAIGLFKHSGVANHPGDKGMQAIADRICDTMEEVLGIEL
jgi:hypothetical protein